MDIKNIVAAGVTAAIVCAVAFIGFMHTPVDSNAPVVSTHNYGALTGPDIPFPYLKWGGGNGIAEYAVSQPLNTGSTTPCFIISPNATSTWSNATIRLDTSSTTAMTIEFGIGSNTGAVATQIGTNYVVAANAQGFITASSSVSGTTLRTDILSPNTPLVWLASGGTGTYSPVGSCGATFRVLP